MLIESLTLTNFLSFGQEPCALSLRPLNVLIGPNASGKSNTLEAFGLLRDAPRELGQVVREGGGVHAWLWQGQGQGHAATEQATIEVVLSGHAFAANDRHSAIRYRLSFEAEGHRFSVADERIENGEPASGQAKPYFYFGYERGRPMLNVNGETRKLRSEDIDPRQSILAQRKDPDAYPELTRLGELLGQIQLYRDWQFGRRAQPRRPQAADQQNATLEPDASNLGLVLNRLRFTSARAKIVDELRELFEGVVDYEVKIEASTVQVFLIEEHGPVPATRLSDGTLRYLALLCVLCDPSPPPLICIEEPELGLHPDILPNVARLLREASERTQLLVTTHSDVLVDALQDDPESIIVCERHDGGTTLARLDAESLAVWLDKYSLGTLWRRGDLGGTRW